jgi:C4-dicarboxylate-specific signal transduction histidine kinase
MKKQTTLIILGMMMVLTASLTMALDNPQITAKIDPDTNALFRILDPNTETKIGVPIAENYGTAVIAELKTTKPEIKLGVYLVDKQSKAILRSWIEGPFTVGEDIHLDLRGGTLSYIDYDDQETETVEETKTTEEPEVKSTENEEATVETVEETTQETTPEETTETVPVTGNSVFNTDFYSRINVWFIASASLIVVFVAFLFIHSRRKKKSTKIPLLPEEKEILRMQKKIQERREKIQLLKRREKMKGKLESTKDKLARELAKEENQISKLKKVPDEGTY